MCGTLDLAGSSELRARTCLLVRAVPVGPTSNQRIPDARRLD
ncbi:hypothetical protein [Pseudovibrio sp. W64]|nr:hypothetical protein [Pseudovibrio sp. W64]